MARMATTVPSLNQVSNQGKQNLPPALVGGGGLLIGSALLGPAIGPAIGGTVAGAAVGGQNGDVVTLVGMMNGVQNLLAGGGGSTSGGSRRRM